MTDLTTLTAEQISDLRESFMEGTPEWAAANAEIRRRISADTSTKVDE